MQNTRKSNYVETIAWLSRTDRLINRAKQDAKAASAGLAQAEACLAELCEEIHKTHACNGKGEKEGEGGA